jgi:virginiamycin B lyase
MTLKGVIIYSSLKKRFPVTGRITVCILFIAVASCLLRDPRVARGAGPITEFPIPTSSVGSLTEITTGVDGNLWFIETTSPDESFGFGQIHRMTIRDTISFTSTFVQSSLVGITSGQLGEILFAEPNRSRIGRIFPPFDQTPPQIDEIVISQKKIRPRGVASLDNAIWFTSFSTGQIGRIPLNTYEAITYFDIKTPCSRPSAMTVGPDSKSLYIIIEVSKEEASRYSIGRITLDGHITEFPIPDAASRPKAITTGPDGNIWFTDPALNSIWRLTPEGGFSSFTISTEESEPSGIVAGPDGKLYFTEFEASQIGVITTDGVIAAEIPTPAQNGGPSGITVGSDGNIWFIESNALRVGRLELAADLGLSVTTSTASAGKDQDITFTINVTNQGPDSVANATIFLGNLLPNYTIVSCDAGAAGGVCQPVDGEAPNFLIRIPFIPNGGVVTSTVVARITNCSVSSGATALPEISTGISVSSRVPDQTFENNTRVVTINTSPPAKITVMGGGAEIRLGPVTPGVSADQNAPAVIFRLENTGCAPLELTVDSLQRVLSTSGGGLCPQPRPQIGDDFKFFEIRVLEPATTSENTRQADRFGQPLRSGMRLPVIPPGESISLSVQFKAQLPGFVGDNPLNTDLLLPDEINTQLTLSQPQVTLGSDLTAPQVLIGPPTTAPIKGLISPVAQIVPRDPVSNPLAQLTTSGDKFEVRFSVFDAKLNVRRATYQFFDRFRRPVTSPINVSLENAICQKGIVSGQSFTVLSRFSGAATHREIAHVQVTVFDDEGSSTANSFPSFVSATPERSATAQPAMARSAATNFTVVSAPLMRLLSQSKGAKSNQTTLGTRGDTAPGAVGTGRLAGRAFRWAPGPHRSRRRTNGAWFVLDGKSRKPRME